MKTDADFLLDVLHDGEWHSLNSLLQRSFAERGCGLTVHSRAADLRKRGFDVEHRMVGRRGDGSMYRLLRDAAEGGGVAQVVASSPSRDALRGDDAKRVGGVSEQLELVPAEPEQRGAYWQAVA